MLRRFLRRFRQAASRAVPQQRRGCHQPSRRARRLTGLVRLEELENRLVPSPLPRPDHVVVVMEENHAYDEIIGSSAAPYLNSLASQGAVMTQSFALTHPSQPNYLDLFSGSDQGVTTDTVPPPGSPYATANLAEELINAGLTFGGYSEDMPSVGYTGSTYKNYARRHNPWVDFSNVPAADNMPFAGYFPSDFTQLPTVSFVIPDLQDDMHNGTVQQGDTWLKDNLSAYAQWAETHNSLLIVTWDEDDGSENNQIPTLFVGQMVTPGQYAEHITHFNVLRTIEDLYGLPYAGQSANVAPISDIWATGPGGTVTHFGISAPSASTAGSAFQVMVTALDAYNNVVPGYTGTVHFTSSDGKAVLPASYTFTTADNGSHTFTGVTLKTAGSQTVTATDTANSALAVSTFVAVSPAAASHFTVSGYPSPTTAGVAHSFTVTAKDPYGNRVTSYTGTVSFSSSDGQAVLPASYTFTSSNQGRHTFSAILKTAGSQLLTVTDRSGLSGTQAGIRVHPAAASQLQITAPATFTPGTPFSITVTALDPYGNRATGYRGTVQFTSSDSLATLPSDYTFTATDSGSHLFSNGVTLETADSQTITATDTQSSTITGSATLSVSSSATAAVVRFNAGSGLSDSAAPVPVDPLAPPTGQAAGEMVFASLPPQAESQQDEAWFFSNRAKGKQQPVEDWMSFPGAK